MTINIYILIYLLLACYSAGYLASEYKSEIDTAWRYWCFVFIVGLFMPILFTYSSLSKIAGRCKTFLFDYTPAYYLWKEWSGYYDKLPKEELENVIARVRGKIKYANNNELTAEHKWKLFIKYGQRMVNKYDSDNKIEPNLFA